MSDDTGIETQESHQQNNLNEQARKYASETFLKPQEAFAKFVTSLIPITSTDIENVGTIYEATRMYNEVAEPDRRINLLYHFTDDNAAQVIKEQDILGKEGKNVYFTSITPDQARPLFSAKDGKL